MLNHFRLMMFRIAIRFRLWHKKRLRIAEDDFVRASREKATIGDMVAYRVGRWWFLCRESKNRNALIVLAKTASLSCCMKAAMNILLHEGKHERKDVPIGGTVFSSCYRYMRYSGDAL